MERLTLLIGGFFEKVLNYIYKKYILDNKKYKTNKKADHLHTIYGNAGQLF